MTCFNLFRSVLTLLFYQEVSGVVVRVLGTDLKVMKRVASLHMLETALNNKHIAAELMDVITKRLGIEDRVRPYPSKNMCC